ncbi:MAG: glycosyltransferase family 4 protein [Thermoplasmata archaeon]|nr:glycosyltransferase family 4 protein [Thermoplasmata archaeon]
MIGAAARPLSVLWLNQLDPGHPWAGGAERHIEEVGRRLVARGHRVTVVAESFEGLSPETDLFGMKILRPVPRGLLHAWVLSNARRLVEDHSVDIVVGDLSKIVPWGRKSLGGAPLVSVFRHFSGQTIFTEAPFPAAPILWAVERLVPTFLRRSEIVTESRATASILNDLGAHGAEISRIPPGVDAARFSPEPSARSPTPLIAYVGRLKRYKRLEHALRAFSLVRATSPQSEFHIAGGGSDHDRLVERARALGLSESVRFLGSLSVAEIVQLYRRAWVHVQPSCAEGWGLTALESMACGTPVVAFAAVSLPETVGPLCADLLAADGDVRSLADAMVRGLARPERLDPMAAQRLAQYAAGFSWDITADRYTRLLAHVADCRPRARPTPSAWSRPSPAGRTKLEVADRASDHAGPG